MDATMMWTVLFVLPLVAIVTIIGFARHHASEVEEDGRDDKPEDA